MFCSKCILDSRIPGITFDENGVCNYCKIHDEMCKEYPTGEKGKKILAKIAENIKRAGRKSKYDCVIGVSGGCDSSYLLYLARKLGLRPLAVHFDNTWNSTIAVENIHIMLKKLDIELYTYVIDNEEFNDLSRAFLSASVPEIDAPTDIALTTILYLAAEKHKIKYILNAHTFRTEGISPIGWWYFDGKYVQSIHRQLGKRPMKTFPNLWLRQWLKWLILNRIKRIRPLYYVDYRKEETKRFLTENFGWRWYGGHHMENKFTFFNHNYILPKKFDIDLRLVEFSALVRSGQMTKREALEKISKPMPIEENLVNEVKKRLHFTDEEFNSVLSLPKKTAKNYETYRPTFKRMRSFFWLMYKLDLVPKSFFIKYTR